jgi:hypothetical protein
MHMTDFPMPGTPTRWTLGPLLTWLRLLQGRALVIAFLLALGWCAVEVKVEYDQRQCDSPLGKMAVRLKLDQHYSGCRCIKHSMDFSDPCNSGYIGAF